MGIKLKVIFWFLSLAVLFQTAAFSANDPIVFVGGQQLLFENYKIKDGFFYVNAGEHSLAQMAELLGASLTYSPSENQMMIRISNRVIYLFPSGLSVDGKNVSLAAPSILDDDNWYVSLNTLAKAFGASITFDPQRNAWVLDPYVTGISLKPNDGGGFDVLVDSTGPVEPSVTTLDNPDRIVADFPYSVLASNVALSNVESNSLIGSVRFSQLRTSPNAVRLVIGILNPDLHFTTTQNSDGKHFTLSLAPNVPLRIFEKPAPPENEQTTAEKQAPQSTSNETPTGSVSSLTDAAFQETEENGSEIFIVKLKLNGSTAYEWHQLKSPDNRIFIDFKNCVQGIASPLSYQSPLVEDIRLSQFQKTPIPVTRMVLSLRDSYHVDVKPNADGAEVVVTSSVENLAENLSGIGKTGSPQAVTPHPVGMTVVLDPGHGGKDTGAIGKQLMEKDVTLDLAYRLRALLVKDGFNVLMTRSTDQECLGYEGDSKSELQCRADVANRTHAVLFISIHINASDYSWPNGVSTHWYKTIDEPLAAILQNHLAEAGVFQNRGIIRNRFYVLRNTDMPAVLVEIGFITNSRDAEELGDSVVREKIVEALKSGIEEYSGTQLRARL